MALLDLLGALLTLLCLGLLGLGGFLAALLLLGRRALVDRLALAVSALLAAQAIGVAIALALGAPGLLRLPVALALLAATVAALAWAVRRSRTAPPPALAVRTLAAAAGHRLRRHVPLALIAFHAGGSEALRGLLRPPLAWDSLMYHLLLTASWLQQGDLAPVFGRHPVSFFGYAPGNGALWVWWWMAPSHSELYVNLAYLPQWALLGLATGALARQLGAKRSWPLAAFVVLVLPAVVRFAATQYVDVPLAAVLLSGAFLGLRWLERPRWGTALAAGTALGLAAGTKVLGLAYALALAAALVGAALVRARDGVRRRAGQVALAALAMMLLGSFFYLRNEAAGAGALGGHCAALREGGEVAALGFAGPQSVVAGIEPLLASGQLVDAFLGVTWPPALELGVGPAAAVLLLAALALPFAFGGPRRWPAWVLASQVAVQGVLWATVPFAANNHIFANLRYLLGALGIAVAAAVALGDRFTGRRRWLEWLAIALALQGLLMLHAEMPRGVRLAIAAFDLAAVALVVASPLRRWLATRWRWAAALAALALLAAVPPWAAFRTADRARALAEEYTAHSTTAHAFAGAWGWLDAHGGDGAVAVSIEPGNRFVYPAMGPRLARRATYVNVNRADHRNAAAYPACNPRVDPDRAAWLDNLEAAGIRWLLVGRFPGREWPLEDTWAGSRPRRFRLLYEDPAARIYQFAGR